jgi:hypothetical protein
MIVLNTSAADFNAMLTAVRNFLSANGWTVFSDGIAGTSTLIMQNSTGHKYRLNRTTNNQTDFYTGAFVDVLLNISWDRGNTGGTPGVWSTVTTTNDMAGPFPNLWLFTDEAATFCYIVAQTAPVRYSHSGFGEIDPKGLHESRIDFASGLYWYFWSNSAEYEANNNQGNPFNYLPNGNHRIDLTDGTAWIGIPDGLLDPGLFFTDGPTMSQPWKLNDREYVKSTGVNNTAYWADYFCNITNKPFAGGIILSPLPVAANPASQDVMAIVGEYPQIALVNMQGLSPGQTLTLADDEWLVFPWKQFGTAEAMKYGSNPLPQPNSWRYGFAYRSN